MELADALDDCGGLLPHLPERERSPALCDGATGVWRTRGGLRDQALRVGKALASPRKRLVFVIVGPGPAAIVSILAAASAGHAVALIDAAMAQPKIAGLIESYRPELVLGPDREGLDWLADKGYCGPEALSEGVVLIERASEAQPEADIHPALLLLLATSGTTGIPRFVRLSREAVLANANQIAKALHIGVDSVGVAHLPIHYSYGWSIVGSHFAAGAGVVAVSNSLMSKTFWETIAKAGGTHFPGVPFHYTTMARLGLNSIPECVATLTQAGGGLDLKTQAKVHEFAEGRGAKFFVMYGQTEAAPRMTTLPHAAFAAKTGSVGVALPGGRIGVERDGAAAPVGEPGDVVYTGPNVMLGYASCREDLALGDEMHGRLETGDVGYVDADGFLYLTGRTKRFAKIAGLRLGLDQMEKEFVSAATVACVDGGDKILVYYDDAAENILKERVRAIAIEYKIPSASFALKRVAAIPRTTGGKINYGQLKENAGV